MPLLTGRKMGVFKISLAALGISFWTSRQALICSRPMLASWDLKYVDILSQKEVFS